MKISELMAIVLYSMVGVISLMMAYKNLMSDRFIPFQEKAAGTSWNSIDSRLQYVLLTLIRVSGLGFLVIGILLLVTPIVSYFRQDVFLRYAIPILSFIYCSGLNCINRQKQQHLGKVHFLPWSHS